MPRSGGLLPFATSKRSDGERVGRLDGSAVGGASFDEGDAVGGAGIGCGPTNSIDGPVGGGVSAEALPPGLGVVVGSDGDGRCGRRRLLPPSFRTCGGRRSGIHLSPAEGAGMEYVDHGSILM